MTWPVGAPQEVIDFLTAMVPVTETRISQDQGEQIAAFLAERGGYSLFVELDERPGHFDPRPYDGDWNWKLRQARNGCARFFDILNAREAR